MNVVFMPWYIFNWIHQFKARGKQVFETTIAESFLKKHKKSLTAEEETFLLSATRCPYSLCEVVEVKPGVGMKLLDLFRRYEYEVVERMASQSLKRGDIIYCATTQVGEVRSNVSTIPFALRPTAKRDVLDLRKQIAAEVGDDTLNDFDLHEFEGSQIPAYYSKGVRKFPLITPKEFANSSPGFALKPWGHVSFTAANPERVGRCSTLATPVATLSELRRV